MKTIKIHEDVLRVLSAALIEGQNLALVGQLDRKLYVETNKVLEAAGGKWNRKAKAHVFDGDAAEVIEPIIMTGEYGRPKQDFGQFDSPPAVVGRIMELAGIEPGMSVLEPSAGLGNIAVAAIEKGGHVCTVEVDASRAAKLTMLIGRLSAPTAAHSTAVYGSLLEQTAEKLGVFDRIVMNPPFARRADIEHVSHALDFLRTGGRLVSVMSNGVLFREDRCASNFRTMVAARGGMIERLPDGAFSESGTMVKACIVTIG